MWFIFALICILGWGFADLFYKSASAVGDRYSHLKIAVWVGLVMGVCAVLLIPFAESGSNVVSLTNIIKYSPASLAYIISMVVGYAGMRYIEISIISPIQNASGAFSMILMILYFWLINGSKSILGEYSVLDYAGAAVIVASVILLAVTEQEFSSLNDGASENKKHRFGALALLFPLIYCFFDTVGTAADGIILDEQSGMNLGEIDVIILYGLTFFVAGIVCWCILILKTKKIYNPFSDPKKGIAAGFEEIGQIFYVYAMASNPVMSAPMVASYCIVSVILSHIILKERLKFKQYICVCLVIAGIIMLGISEGLAQ